MEWDLENGAEIFENIKNIQYLKYNCYTGSIKYGYK